MSDTQLTLREVRGLLNDLSIKLSGKDWKKWYRGLKRFLREEDPWGLTLSDFPVWKTIKLSPAPRCPEDYREAIKSSGYMLGGRVDHILRRASVFPMDHEEEVDLVTVSPAELGLSDFITVSEIFDRAEDVGFGQCSVWVAVQLARQFKIRPKDGEFIFAIDPALYPEEGHWFLSLSHDGHSRLFATNYGEADSQYMPNARFIFVRPRHEPI